MDLNRKIAQLIGERYIFETAPTIISTSDIIDDTPPTSPPISNITTDNIIGGSTFKWKILETEMLFVHTTNIII